MLFLDENDHGCHLGLFFHEPETAHFRYDGEMVSVAEVGFTVILATD